MGIKDGGTLFEIVPYTRKVTVPQVHKVIGTVGEHFAEQITFKCPKVIDGKDVSGCVDKYVTWKNNGDEMGNDTLNLLTAEEAALRNLPVEDGTVYLTWDISGLLTTVKGLVSFSVHFSDQDDTGKKTYRWSTTTCTDCEVLDSLNAALGVYERIYVSENKLVIADFTPVHDKTLSLESNPNGTVPTGEIDITANGKWPVGGYATANVAVELNPDPLEITTNGEKNVASYAKVNVNVRQPDIEETLVITENTDGPRDITWHKTLEVNVPQPSGKTTITQNFQKNVNVKDYEYVDVEIPYPTATRIINANGVHPCHGYGFVDVRVGDWEADPPDPKDLIKNTAVKFYNNTGSTVTLRYTTVTVSGGSVSRSLYTTPVNSKQLYEAQVECHALLVMTGSARFAIQIDGPGNVATSDTSNVLVHPVHFAPRSGAYKVGIVSV